MRNAGLLAILAVLVCGKLWRSLQIDGAFDFPNGLVYLECHIYV